MRNMGFLGAATGAVLFAAATAAAYAAEITELPEGPDRDLVANVCQSCHDLLMVFAAAGFSSQRLGQHARRDDEQRHEYHGCRSGKDTRLSVDLSRSFAPGPGRKRRRQIMLGASDVLIASHGNSFVFPRPLVRRCKTVSSIEIGKIGSQFVTQGEFVVRSDPRSIDEAATLHFKCKRGRPRQLVRRKLRDGF